MTCVTSLPNSIGPSIPLNAYVPSRSMATMTSVRCKPTTRRVTAIGSKRLSKHAQGIAIDINPLYNPCVTRKKDGTLIVEPSTGKPYINRNAKFPYKIKRGDLCYRLFIQHGFRWGGDWKSKKDYQHFEFGN